jgi:hypothetical protein
LRYLERDREQTGPDLQAARAPLPHRSAGGYGHSLTIQDGALLTACQPLTGVGNFIALAAGGCTLNYPATAGHRADGQHRLPCASPAPAAKQRDASYIVTVPWPRWAGPASQVRNLTTINANNVTLNFAERWCGALTVGSTDGLVLNGRALTLPSGAAGATLIVNNSTGLVRNNAQP